MQQRSEHRFFSHYQSKEGSTNVDSESLKRDSVSIYLSPVKSKNNKENINVFEEVSNLIRQYQQNPIKSNRPQNSRCDQRVFKEVCRKLRNSKAKLQVSRKDSISPKPIHSHSINEAMKLSPILKTQYSSPQHKQSLPLRCSIHQNKKAKFFDNVKSQVQFYCSNCSIYKILKGKTLNPIEDYYYPKHRNILSDSGLPGRKDLNHPQVSSISRANFWSVDENSLLSQNILPETVQMRPNQFGNSQNKEFDTFESSVCDDEQRIKEIELMQFQQELHQLRNRGEQMLMTTHLTSYANKASKYTRELEKALKFINVQTNKLITTLQTMTSTQISQDQVKTAQEVLIDLNSINSDVNSNRDNIMHSMQLKPFKSILNKYREKFHAHETLLNRFSNNQSQLITNYTQLTQLVNYLEGLRNTYKSYLGFELDQLEDSSPPQTDPDDLQNTSRNLKIKTKNTNHVYISFENKDLFLAAQRNSVQKVTKDQSSDLVQLSMNQCSDKKRSCILESPNFLRG